MVAGPGDQFENTAPPLRKTFVAPLFVEPIEVETDFEKDLTPDLTSRSNTKTIYLPLSCLIGRMQLFLITGSLIRGFFYDNAHRKSTSYARLFRNCLLRFVLIRRL